MSQTTDQSDIITDVGEQPGIQYNPNQNDFKPTLTKWANEPTINKLKADLTTVTGHHDTHVRKVEYWLDAMYVRGHAKPEYRKGYSSVQPPLIRKQAEWRYAALSEPFLAPDDLYRASPVTFEDKAAAYQNELVLNTQWRRDIDRTHFIDTYVRAAVDTGTAIVRTGWDFHSEEYEVEVPVFEYVEAQTEEDVALMNELAIMAQESPSDFMQQADEYQEALALTLQDGIVYVPQDTGETTTVIEEEIIYNRPTVQVVPHTDVMFDPTCKGDFSKAKFAIYRYPTSLALLKKEGGYSNLDYIQGDAMDSVLAMPDTSAANDIESFNFKDTPRKLFYAYEYWGFWDIHNEGILRPIVATFVGNTVIKMEENPYPDKELPFVVVPYLPVRDSIYGEPDAVLIEDNQKVAGAVTRGMIDLMARSANAQQGVRKDFLDPMQRRKFDRGDDYEFNPGVDPQRGVYMHQYPEIPQSAPFMLELQNREAESLTGVKAFSGGLSGDGLGETATGVRGVLDAASKRELGILRRLADGMVKIGRKQMAMNAEFLSDEEIIRITNENFVSINREDLKGQIDLKLDITTAEEDAQKAQEISFMLQTVAPNGDPELNKMMLAELFRLRKMPEMAKRIETYTPQPDPLDQEIKMLEREKLIAEIAVLHSEAAENHAEANLDNAKANQAQSDADKKDLDFLEQEKGIKHAREVDKITSQSKAQAETKVVEAFLKQHEQRTAR